jgi:hypothetical protein
MPTVFDHPQNNGDYGSMHALPWDSAAVDAEQKHFAAARAGGGDHSFAGAEFHRSRGKVGDTDDQPAEQVGWLAGFL